ECELSEQHRPRFQHVRVVLEQPLFIQIRLVNLALHSVVFDEPVITKRLCILLPCDPYDFGRLGFESIQLSWPDLQVRMHFQMAHDSSSFRHGDSQTRFGTWPPKTIRMIL